MGNIIQGLEPSVFLFFGSGLIKNKRIHNSYPGFYLNYLYRQICMGFEKQL